jgi:hypothetical protein
MLLVLSQSRVAAFRYASRDVPAPDAITGTPYHALILRISLTSSFESGKQTTFGMPGEWYDSLWL